MSSLWLFPSFFFYSSALDCDWIRRRWVGLRSLERDKTWNTNFFFFLVRAWYLLCWSSPREDTNTHKKKKKKEPLDVLRYAPGWDAIRMMMMRPVFFYFKKR